MKKVVSMLLMLCMILSMSVVAFAAPAGNNFTGYTREDAIWGEVWGNATESFVIKILDASDNVMGTTSLNNIGSIIDGDVSVTWSIKLDAESNTDEYWTMAWTTAPSVENMPAKVELWVDGVKVSGGNVVLNAPDDLNKLSAAAVDANGKITKYYTSFEAAVAESNNVAILRAGTYAVPGGKDMTITGAVEGVVFDNIGAKNMGYANVTFNNVTFDYYPNVNYTGLQHSGNLVYNNCTINGQVFLYGTSETFNKCTFNQNSADAYNVWTYGAKEVEFNDCIFNCVGKSVLIYAEGSTIFNDVTVEDCEFNASAPVEGKAAIEMDSSLTSGINLTIDSDTTATGFGSGNVSGNSLWNNKKGSATEANNDITVVVGDETVLKPVFEAEIGGVKYFKLEQAIEAAKNGDVITLLSDIEKDVTITQAPDIKFTIDGKGKTFDGVITINGKSARYATAGVTIKNVNFYTEDALSADAFINLGKEGDNSTRYTNNVTVENCTFDAKAGLAPVVIKSYTGGDHNLKVIGCTVSQNMHSLLQAANIEEGLVISGCKVYSKNGINLNSTYGLEMTDCEFDVKGYAVRIGVDGTVGGEGNEFVLENNILKSACEDGDAVIIFRDNAKESSLTMKKNAVVGDTHFKGNTDSTDIEANGNYWGGANQPTENGAQVNVCEYYSDEARTDLVKDHKDDNKDHICEKGCGIFVGVCEDADKDHACDYGCDKVYGTCEDADKNHACDYGCDKVYGEHKDADKDHACDYGCSVAIGEHKDSADDKDHICDYCKSSEVLEACTPATDAAKAPTCTETGLTEGSHCSVCEKVLVAQEIVDATGHDMAEATCTKPATCKVCGHTEGEALGHDYGYWKTVEEATEKYGGRQEKTCKACGAKVSRYTKPLGQDGITVITPSDKVTEENPNTGAPLMIPVVAVAAVLSGAVVFKRK